MTAKLLALDVLMRRIATMDYLVADGASPPAPAPPFSYGLRFARFLGLVNTPPLINGDPVVARAAFMAYLTAPSVETCEGLTLIDPATEWLTQNPTLTFGSITSTATNTQVDYDQLVGRMNTTSGGTQFIETSNENAALFTFSAPVFAFGCYMTDVGDFESELLMLVTFTDGTEQSLRWAATQPNDYALLFLGFITPDLGVTKVKVLNFGGMKSTPTPIDAFGYDDIVAAPQSQVAGGTINSYPTPWATTYIYEWRHWVRFDAVAALGPNLFRNGGDVDQYATDSVADSVAAGTFQPIGPYAGHGSYRIVAGSRVTGTSGGVSGNAVTVRGWIRRTGASVGTGRFFSGGDVVRLSITGGNKLQADFATYDAPTTTIATVTSAASLALNTWTYFVATAVRVRQPSVSIEIRCAVYLGTTMDANSGNTYSSFYGYTNSYHFGTYGGSSALVIGGADASNYANVDLADIAVGPVLVADIPLPIVVPTVPPWRTF